jgi:hypothetical protein
MCFVWISDQTATFALYINERMVFITEVESVYSAVRTDSLYKTDYFRSLKGMALKRQVTDRACTTHAPTGSFQKHCPINHCSFLLF